MSGLSTPRRGALVGQVGATVLAVYATLKPMFGPRDGWVLPFVPTADSWLVYHLLEVLPVALVVVGLFAIYRSQRSANPPVVRGGFALTIAAAFVTVVAHTFEHLTAPITIDLAVVGAQNVWMWVYYGGWFAVATGLAFVGSTAARTTVLDGRTKLLWSLTVPFGFGFMLLFLVAVGNNLTQGFKLAIALSVFTGCFRLASLYDGSTVGERSVPADD